MKLSGIVASAVALAGAFALHTDVFTYVDHWPSGSGDETATAVVVPENVDGTTLLFSVYQEPGEVCWVDDVEIVRVD